MFSMLNLLLSLSHLANWVYPDSFLSMHDHDEAYNMNKSAPHMASAVCHRYMRNVWHN